MNEKDAEIRVSVIESKVQGISSSVEKLEEKINNNKIMLHERISDLRDDLRKDISTSNDKIIGVMEENRKSSSEQHRLLSEKIQGIEKWRWMIMGGAIVVGYVLAHIKLSNIF